MAGMREGQAAERLAALLNDIRDAGHDVRLESEDAPGIWVGNHFMYEPHTEHDAWAVES